MNKTICALSISALLLAGCGDGPLGPERDALEEGLGRWRDADLASYRFDFLLQCFCGPPAGRFVRVAVDDGLITGGTYKDDGTALTGVEVQQLLTIDELFDRVQQTLDEDPDRFEASYDAELGYPRRVSADPRFQLSDDEFTILTDSLAPPLLGGASRGR